MPTPATVTDTIAAISTPPGRGGIGIVRLSGPQAASIAAQLVRLRHPLDNLAQLECAAQQQLQHHGRAVGCDLDEVFGGIGAGSGEKCDQGFVDARGVVIGGVKHVSETRVSVFELGKIV